MTDGGSGGEQRRRVRRFALSLVPLVLVLYAALLRFDALVERHGAVAGPSSLEAAQGALVDLAKQVRPSDFEWRSAGERRGDPVSYLKIARARSSFYQADFREPLYVASVRAFLWLTGDQDVTVSCASAVYSTLLVLATYLVGSYAFGRAVGVGAALLLAVEARVVQLGVDGWRDDAFAFFVLMSAYAMLRVARTPCLGAGLLLGVVSAGAMLTRITSFTFLLPSILWLVVCGPRRDFAPRLSAISVAIVTAALLIAPYLLQCLAVYGDPLIAINFATERFYPPVGDAATAAPSWSGHLERLLGHRPLAAIDTVLRGLTAYPFGNKWEGLRHLAPWLAAMLPAAALLGLALFVGSVEGRLLLVVLFSALAPFALTWEIPGGGEWRFTLFAYPFYLVAAWVAASRIPAVLLTAAREGVPRAFDRRIAVAAAACLACVFVDAYLIPRHWHFALVREAAGAEGAYSIVAGPSDDLFFSQGWYPPVRAGMVTGRYSRGASAAISVPVFDRTDVKLSFRMQACSDSPAPERTVRVSVNGIEQSTLRVVWDPQRAGSYDVVVPATMLQQGWNRVDLEADGSTVMPPAEQRFRALEPGQDSAFFLWYVRVEPIPPQDLAASRLRKNGGPSLESVLPQPADG